MSEPVDFLARRPHWRAHVQPVADELRRRGHVVATYTSHPIDVEPGRITVVASSSDMKEAIRRKRRVVLMEHGAGQSYSNRHQAHVGGHGRAKVELCLLPNAEALERHDRFYAGQTPGVVVGSPIVDVLTERYGGELPSWRRCSWEDRTPTVAVSWHFDSSVSIEAQGAWRHLGTDVVNVLCEMRDVGWIDLLGHSHPKMASVVDPTYEQRAIPIAADFGEVCERADIYMVDNSSTLFEFAALDRPVIVVDSPKYRRSQNHGLRFWWAADIGPRIGRANDVPAAIMLALRDPDEVAKQRRSMIERIYPHRGEAIGRAADAIEAMERR